MKDVDDLSKAVVVAIAFLLVPVFCMIGEELDCDGFGLFAFFGASIVWGIATYKGWFK